jgi:hypothetical protein
LKARVLELEAANKELAESKIALEASLEKQREASDAVATAIPAALDDEVAAVVNGESAELIEKKEAYDAETEALREQVAMLEKKV